MKIKCTVYFQTTINLKKIAEEFNYVPNYSAIALRKQKSNTLAIIVPQISDSYIAQFLSEVQKLAFVYNYRLLFFQSFSSYKNEIKCINQINDGSADGILLISKWNKNLSIEKQNVHYNITNIPAIIINTEEIIKYNSNLEAKVLKYFKDLLIEIS